VRGKWTFAQDRLKTTQISALPDSPNARLPVPRRSSSLVPPQIPASPLSSAQRRQVLETGHVRHTCLACSICGEEERHLRCRAERTTRDPRRGRWHSFADQCLRCLVAAAGGFARDTHRGSAPFVRPVRRGSGYANDSRGGAVAITANPHIRIRLAVPAEPLPAITRIHARR
jgi:hypothetical protein